MTFLNSKIIYFFILFLFFIFIFVFLIYNINISSVAHPSITINNIKINVEIADTVSSQVLGLSGRRDLCAECGLLFVFKDLRIRKFWMKNMNFPLDIIWIANDRISGISENLQPEGDQPKNIYSSGQAVNYVLEVNGGYAEKNGIKIGDAVKFIF